MLQPFLLLFNRRVCVCEEVPHSVRHDLANEKNRILPPFLFSEERYFCKKSLKWRQAIRLAPATEEEISPA